MRLTEKLVLGTVQLGISYGINNQTGQPSQQQALDILSLAKANGIDTLDTASGYGDAERVIGEFHQAGSYFKIITKFGLKEGLDIRKEWERACQALDVAFLECWMYHRFYETHDIPTRNSLLALKANGNIRKIGVSLYDNIQLKEAIHAEWVDVIQMPFNLLDNMSQRGNLLKEAKEKGKEVHTRSVFLQGLFFMDQERIPEKLKPLKPYLETIKRITKENQCTPAAMALKYAVCSPFIDKVLIGVETKEQLQQNINVLSEKINEQVFSDVDKLQVKETSLLSPANW